jgi:hypothetical protein
MNEQFSAIDGLLDDFETELSEINALWSRVRKDNPDFDQVSEERCQERYHDYGFMGQQRLLRVMSLNDGYMTILLLRRPQTP